MSAVARIIIPLPLWCPYCGARHVDEARGEERWDRRAHTTHRCQQCQQDFDVYVSGAPDAADQTLSPEERQAREHALQEAVLARRTP